MTRNVLRAREEYQKKFYRPNAPRASAFCVDQIEQIADATKSKEAAALAGLEAGFYIGYQYAKREAKEKERRGQQ